MSPILARRLVAVGSLVLFVGTLVVVNRVSRPQRSLAQAQPAPGVSIVFVIDNSPTMFPFAGDNYFDLARQGIIEFLNRPGFSKDGSYEISVIQFSERSAAGYEMGEVGTRRVLHWFPPILIATEDDWAAVADLVDGIVPSRHFTSSLLEVGIREATRLLDIAPDETLPDTTKYTAADASTDRHIVLLTTGEYRLNHPCPPSCYTHPEPDPQQGTCEWAPSGTICHDENGQCCDDFATNCFDGEACDRACHIRWFADQARDDDITLSSMRLGADWHTELQGSCTRTPDPYDNPPNNCRAWGHPTYADPPDIPDRQGFLMEISNWNGNAHDPADSDADACIAGEPAGRVARVNPFFCFGCGDPNFAPGTAFDISDTIAGWLCEWNNDPAADGDGDGMDDICDNCPNVANPRQRDCNRDRRGDACQHTLPMLDPRYCDSSTDSDLDGLCDDFDLCPGGDDCLVALWNESQACDALGPNACTCDCDHSFAADGLSDACQAAVELEQQNQFLPLNDSNDGNPKNGIPDYCEDSQNDCDPVPQLCDIDDPEPISEDFETGYTASNGTAAISQLEANGWLHSDSEEHSGVSLSHNTAESVTKFGIGMAFNPNATGAWSIMSPAVILPDQPCEPAPTMNAESCATLPDTGKWGIVAIEIDLLIKNNYSASALDVEVIDPCVEDSVDAERVHLRIVNDEFAAIDHPTDPLWGAQIPKILISSPNNFCDYEYQSDFRYLSNYPVDRWFTITIMFNDSVHYDISSSTNSSANKECFWAGTVSSVRFALAASAPPDIHGWGPQCLNHLERGRHYAFTRRGLRVRFTHSNETDGSADGYFVIGGIRVEDRDQCEWKGLACTTQQPCVCQEPCFAPFDPRWRCSLNCE